MTFHKFPDIERLGHEDTRDIFICGTDTIYVEEKVDGGNGSFWIEDDVIHFGSRARDLTVENDDKAFERQQIWLKEHLEKINNEDIKLNQDYIYYIEWLQLHTLHYNNPPPVIGLDIRLKRSMNVNDCGLFISREAKENEFVRLKIPVVPLIWKGTVDELKKINIQSLITESRIENWDGRLVL